MGSLPSQVRLSVHLRSRSPAADICAPDLLTVRTYVEGLRETSAALLDLIAASGLGSGEIEEGAAEDSGKGKKKLLYEDVSSPLTSGWTQID